MKQLIILLIIASLGWYGYTKFQDSRKTQRAVEAEAQYSKSERRKGARVDYCATGGKLAETAAAYYAVNQVMHRPAQTARSKKAGSGLAFCLPQSGLGLVSEPIPAISRRQPESTFQNS